MTAHTGMKSHGLRVPQRACASVGPCQEIRLVWGGVTALLLKEGVEVGCWGTSLIGRAGLGLKIAPIITFAGTHTHGGSGQYIFPRGGWHICKQQPVI